MKYLKLGPKAMSFTDLSTSKKVLPGQVVPFSKQDMKSHKTGTAYTYGHLIEATEAEYDEYVGRVSKKTKATNSEQDQTNLSKKMTKKDWIEKITAEFELDSDGLKELKSQNLSELEQTYRDWTEQPEGDLEDGDDK